MTQPWYFTLLEISSVVLNIFFIVLLTRERRSCWIYGIAGSMLGAVLFYFQHYYSETLLYLFYAGIGIYGWMVWGRAQTEFKIQKMKIRFHLALIGSGILMFLGLGYGMSHTDADKPYFDAFSTVFGVMASFMEIYKYLSAWIYWIAINAFSVWLYGAKSLWIYSALMLAYTFLSFRGYILWRKKWEQNA